MVVEIGRAIDHDTCRHCDGSISRVIFGNREHGDWFHDGDSLEIHCPGAPVAEPSGKGSNDA